jgi:integrase
MGVSPYKQTPASLAVLPPGSKVGDGASLFWLKGKDGSLVAWQRVTQDGKQRDVRVGQLTGVPVKPAELSAIRKRGMALRTGASSGQTVVADAPPPSVARGYSSAMTLAEAWAAYSGSIDGRAGAAWAPITLKKARERMSGYIEPTAVWTMTVGDITSLHLIEVLEPIRASKPQTEEKVRGILKKMFSMLVATRVLPINPTSGISDYYGSFDSKKVVTTHLPTFTEIEQLRTVYRSIGTSSGTHAVRTCLQLQALTLLRSAEVATLQWTDISDDGKTLRVPRNRMKTKHRFDEHGRPIDHVIPLTDEAQRLIASLRRRPGQVYLFESKEGVHVVKDSLSKHFRETLGLRGGMVPHGWRASAMSIGQDAVDADGRPLFSQVWLDSVLDHAEPDQVRAAYARLPPQAGIERVMTWWSQQLTGNESCE